MQNAILFSAAGYQWQGQTFLAKTRTAPTTSLRVTSCKMEKQSLLIVDDHPMVCSLLASLAERDETLKVCGEASGVQEALSIAQKAKPDAAIIDISLDDGNGVDLLKRLLRIQPEMKILVCSMHDESVFAPRVVDVGGLGFINKRAPHEQIVEALRAVMAGELWLSPEMRQRLEENHGTTELTGIHSLSNRELEVLRLIAQGMTPAKMAEQLHLSVKTVDAHREKIKRKLGMSSAAELLRYAVQWSLEGS